MGYIAHWGIVPINEQIYAVLYDYTIKHWLRKKNVCAKFGWNWPSCSGEEYFLNIVNVFSLLSPLEKECGPSFE